MVAPPDLRLDLEEVYASARAGAAALMRERLKPPPQLTVSEWADRYRILPKTAAEPGPWRTDRTPYLREIMDCFSDPLVEEVVFMKAAQVGGSEAVLNVTGYFIDQDPAPILYVQTTDQEAEKFSKERIAPMIRDCPALESKVASPRSRTGGNTIESKEFPGGHLGIVGANMPSKLRARPRRVVITDDCDGFPASAGDEGDPIELAFKRTTTFWNRKKALVSTPTTKGRSRIEKAFHKSDKRYYFVPCPHCGHAQVLVWKNLRWEKRDTPDGPMSMPETANYVCEECGGCIEERHKRRMLAEGSWVATNTRSAVRGYHLSALYSPWFSWADMVAEWLDAQGDPEQLRVFINTRLGETYEERGDAPEWQRIYDRRESYPMGECPEGVQFLTIGADSQKNRVEVFAWGWGYGKESWFIEHIVIPHALLTPQAKAQMTEILHRTWPVENGAELPIARFALDTGYDQESAIQWAWEAQDRRVMLVKGDHWKNWTVIVGSPSRSDVLLNGKKTGLQLWPVGGALVKQELYGFLRLGGPLDGEPYPPGWIHLPAIDDELCKQLTAEDLVTRKDARGYPAREWVKNRDRNEMLDGFVYARAAAELCGLGRLKKPTPKPAAQPPPKPRGDDWLGSRGGRGRSRGDWWSR